MIPADHITIDGDTAWWVRDPGEWTDYGSILNELDRPCDTCGSMFDIDIRGIVCPDCHGTGRHVFDIEVATPEAKGFGDFIDSYRVHVVPGMVLQIHDHFVKGPHVRLRNGRAVYVEANERQHRIILPSAAAPGMWAVQLAVVG
jgi:hypothetical protein